MIIVLGLFNLLLPKFIIFENYY